MRPRLTTHHQEQDPTTPLTPVSPWPPALVEANADLPSAKETYGFLAVILTYLGFATYCIWAFIPDHILHRFGWTWYPNREWALLVPCYSIVLVLLTYLSYAGLILYMAPSLSLPAESGPLSPIINEATTPGAWDIPLEEIQNPHHHHHHHHHEQPQPSSIPDVVKDLQLDLSLPVSTLLKEGTAAAHAQAEHSAGAEALVKGELPIEEYTRFLTVLWRIYDALETALEQERNNPVLAPTFDADFLARAPKLAQDIEHLTSLSSTSSTATKSHGIPNGPPFALTPDLQTLFTATPPSLQNYIDHLRSLASSPKTVPLLLAHSYVRYLGDLSGGQIISERVRRVYDLKKEGGGTAFYDFPPAGQHSKAAADGEEETRAEGKKRLIEVKNWFRNGMDIGVGLDEKLKADLVHEANVAFKLNTDIFSTIRFTPPPTDEVAKPQCPFHVPPWKHGKTSAVTQGSSNGLSLDRILSLLLALYIARLVLNGGDWKEPYTFIHGLIAKSA